MIRPTRRAAFNRPRRWSGRYRWTGLSVELRRSRRDRPTGVLWFEGQKPQRRPRRWSGQVGVGQVL
jgi:hypothetical protein